LRIIVTVSAVVLTLSACVIAYTFITKQNPLAFIAKQTPQASVIPAEEIARTPEELTRLYFSGIIKKEYKETYNLLTAQSQRLIPRDEFVTRHESIYEGIDAANIDLSVNNVEESGDKTVVSYAVRMDTLAGEISYQNSLVFIKEPGTGEYLMEWSPRAFFPNLKWDDKVRVKTLSASRGRILDRSGAVLAGDGAASSIGLVPGKMGVSESTVLTGSALSAKVEADIAAIAELLDMSAESVHKKLGASWVRNDVFVPLRTVSKGQAELEESLLRIPGVMITDVTARYYPLAEEASHLVGYIQNVTAEDLEILEDKGYNANSMLGKAGLERIYEDQLRASDGYEINIVNINGELVETLARSDRIDGGDLRLTIDAGVQSKLYDLFAEDKSCAVVMNPKTGGVLALVSAPGYNPNDFVLGMSESKWNALNEDTNIPLYNRFRAALCPGSTMKAITAAIGLNTGIISPGDDFGASGLSWRKDGSWGGYSVTTLTEYTGPANIENALVYSDNIFFAKAALEIGADTFASELKGIGFEEKIPFEYGLYSSIISGTESFTSEIQLADSGFGQGEILINPVHMAAIYASFVNDGDILRPQLLDAGPEIWKRNAFSTDTASIIKNGLIQVIERGTGKSARIPGVILAGKTGTAELKQSKDDDTGTELGWFVMFTADENAEHPLLAAAMVEDVKNRGGSHYLTERVRTLFE
jgi:penicillin-binding protein